METIIAKIGHDGSQILWPNSPEPACRRGFGSQEIIDAAYSFGYAITEILIHPVGFNPQYPDQEIDVFPNYLERFEGYLLGAKGMILVETNPLCKHVLAWANDEAIDPATDELAKLDDFQIESFYRLTQIKSV